LTKFIVEADGGSRGNPGPAGSGAVVIEASSGQVLVEIARFIGIATNNVAEYTALIAALEACQKLDAEATVSVRMDSKLVIEQMSGRWQIKHADMRDLAAQARALAVGRVKSYQWIPREINNRADALANKAMDERADSIRFIATDSNHGELAATVSTPMAAVAEFNAELPSSVRAPGGVTAQLTTIILVRHGRTALTESKRISGRGGENPPLSPAGRDDAARVAKAVSQIGRTGPWAHIKAPTAIICSPVLRAHETANIIGSSLSVTPRTDEDLSEISFGAWDGLTNDEARSAYPELFEQWRGSWQVSPPGGEALIDFDARVAAARDRIFLAHPGETVVVVSHVMPTRGFIRAAFEAGISSYWRPQISPCSISIVRFWGNETAEVLAINATAHLAD
jgi:probable phosphoglycerate mutase